MGLNRSFLLCLAAAAVAVVGVLALWAGPVYGAGRAETDTVHYALHAFEFAGYSPADARQHAIKLVCDDKVHYGVLSRPACVNDLTGVLGFPKPYQDIFAARPGYPWFSSLFIRLLGDGGMAVAVLVLQVLTGVFLALAGRALGLRGWWPLAGVVAYFCLPAGFVGTRMLTESAAAPGYAALLYAVAVLGTGAADRRRLWAMTGVAAAALGWLFAVRAADAIPAAGLLAVSAAFVWWRSQRSQQSGAYRGAAMAALLGLAAATAASALALALGWPGLSQAVKDPLTDHFTRPTPPDLYRRFLHEELHFWPLFAKQISGGALLCAAAVLGLLGVVRALGQRSWTVLGIAAVGAFSLAVHLGDWARMLAPMWIVVAVGLPLLKFQPTRPPALHPLPSDDGQGAPSGVPGARHRDQRLTCGSTLAADEKSRLRP